MPVDGLSTTGGYDGEESKRTIADKRRPSRMLFDNVCGLFRCLVDAYNTVPRSVSGT